MKFIMSETASRFSPSDNVFPDTTCSPHKSSGFSNTSNRCQLTPTPAMAIDDHTQSMSRSEYELRNFSLVKNLTIDLEAAKEVSSPCKTSQTGLMGNS